MNRRRIRFRPDKFEWLLIGVLLALFLTGAILVVSLPRWWIWYLQILDPRYWASTMWIGAAAILVSVLTAIRFWPRRRKAQPEEELSRVKDVFVLVVGIGILFIAGWCIVDSVRSELHPFPWYWIRLRWYWTNRWWAKSLLPLVLTYVFLRLWIRARRRQSREKETGEESPHSPPFPSNDS